MIIEGDFIEKQTSIILYNRYDNMGIINILFRIIYK